MVLLVDLHALLLAPPANDNQDAEAPARLPSVWACHRSSAALAVAGALHDRGVTAGMCARWWQEAPQRAAERLRGARPLCAEHLAALPLAARRAALDALSTLTLKPAA